ncbi:MAG TPA: hypothetical protein VM487_13770 [Phycisphaerae bacterium]|nr:hypothetical protein [Phycisphaerae bacterium]
MKTSTMKTVFAVVPPWAWVAVPVGAYLTYRLWPTLKALLEGTKGITDVVNATAKLAQQGIKNIVDLPQTLSLMRETAKGEAELAIYNEGAAARTETFVATQVNARQMDLLKSIKGDGKLAGEMARDWASYAHAGLLIEARSIAADFTAVGSDVQAWIKGLGIN